MNASRVLWIALLLNLLVAVLKLAYGLWTHTISMVADGVHSLTDAGASIMGLVTLLIAHQPSDEDHHYGHHKFETIAALGIGAMIGLTSWEILKASLGRFSGESSATFHLLGILIMLGTMAINYGLSIFERRRARALHSQILEADAFHTASDFWVSLSVLISIVFLNFGWNWADPLVSCFISLFLGWTAYRLVRENVLVLTDAAFVDANVLRELALSIEGVLSCDRVRTRGGRGSIFMDLHIQVDPEISTARAHDIAHKVEDLLRSRVEGVKDVIVHTEPYRQ